jgi:hypothetical protein
MTCQSVNLNFLRLHFLSFSDILFQGPARVLQNRQRGRIRAFPFGLANPTPPGQHNPVNCAEQPASPGLALRLLLSGGCNAKSRLDTA